MSKRICVFCSSSSGLDPLYFAEAERFSEGLAARGWDLVFGGATVGLMGHFADEALRRGVAVRGAIPTYLSGDAGEVPHRGITELVETSDLFERKRWMIESSHAFAIYPGGFGTLDEAMEVVTWKILNQLDKPIYFVNLKGFWRTQLDSYEEIARAGAISRDALGAFEVVASSAELFGLLDRDLAPTPGD